MSEQLKIWWENLSEREQQLSLLSGAFLLLAVIYWGAWKPLTDQLQDSKKQLSSAQQTLTWMQDKTAMLVQAGVGRQSVGASQLTLVQIINDSAKQYGINFSRIVNKREQIEVWIDDVDFDLFVRWLTALNNQYFVSVITTDFSKIEQEGHIKVNRLLLGK
ncbi:MAG: type II secretion system protein M [Psychromonas sp.]|nr:type II secretion system protein M [Psychromonas sp.]